MQEHVMGAEVDERAFAVLVLLDAEAELPMADREMMWREFDAFARGRLFADDGAGMRGKATDVFWRVHSAAEEFGESASADLPDFTIRIVVSASLGSEPLLTTDLRFITARDEPSRMDKQEK